jgi:homoserine kinase
MQIKIPGTLGGFGPGHNSLGLAINKYFEVEVLEAQEHWFVESDSLAFRQNDESNYVVAVATKLAHGLQPHHLKIRSKLDANLGETVAALVAGMELARLVGKAELDLYTEITLAARTFGSGNQATAALLGGVTTSFFEDDEVFASGLATPDYQVLLYYPVEKEAGITANETMVSRTVAEQYGAAGNMLIAAWQNQQTQLAGRLLERDLLEREPSLELTRIRQAANALDVYGTVFANGKIMTLVAREQSQDLLDVLAYAQDLRGRFELLELAKEGIIIE